MAQTVTRVIPDGDYPSRLNTLYAAAMAAAEDEKKNPPTLLNGEQPPSVILAAEHEALKAEAEEDARTKDRVITLNALGRSRWRALKVAHPTRTESDGVDTDTAKGDRLAGLNTDAVEDDLVHAAIAAPIRGVCSRDMREKDKACTIVNPCANRGEYDAWVDELSEGEFQMLLRDAWSLVNIAQVDPKSLPPSQTRSNGGN